jgi:catechol 2,3-dioxygenase-like lactoylglutathione lyase family enzyme
MHPEETFPRLRQVVVDCLDARALAEFYRRLLGLRYRPGDEPGGDPRDDDWLVLLGPDGRPAVAFQQVPQLPRVTWPEPEVAQMMHLDLDVGTRAELDHQHERALALGARVLQDRSDDPREALRVYADPAGHPFCIFLAGPG